MTSRPVTHIFAGDRPLERHAASIRRNGKRLDWLTLAQQANKRDAKRGRIWHL